MAMASIISAIANIDHIYLDFFVEFLALVPMCRIVTDAIRPNNDIAITKNASVYGFLNIAYSVMRDTPSNGTFASTLGI